MSGQSERLNHTTPTTARHQSTNFSSRRATYLLILESGQAHRHTVVGSDGRTLTTWQCTSSADHPVLPEWQQSTTSWTAFWNADSGSIIMQGGSGTTEYVLRHSVVCLGTTSACKPKTTWVPPALSHGPCKTEDPRP